MPNTSNTSLKISTLPGDPNCPVCGGLGYVRRDLPVNDPDFGKVQPCVCMQKKLVLSARQRLFEMSNLERLQDKTLETFHVRGRIGLGPEQANSLETAFNHAQQYAQNLKGWLLLQGGFGCGKTHLAAAIANFVVGMGVPTLFITVPDMLDSLRFSFNDTETPFAEHFEEIRQVALLVLDDFGTQNATPWAQEKLFQILNYRYINHLPLVITTNLDLDEMEGRIRSRLQDPELVTRVNMRAPDFRNPSDDAGHAQISSLGLLAKRTFGSFSDRRGENIDANRLESLDKAFQEARRFAENPQGWLLLTGPNGCGKTHLAASIANYRTSLGSPPVFISVLDLLDHLRATFAPTSTVRFDRLFEEVRSAQLLILDDLATQAVSPWAREKLYQLFDHRYYAELPTVITSAEALEQMDTRLSSRFLDARICNIHAITAPSYTGLERKRSRPRTGSRA